MKLVQINLTLNSGSTGRLAYQLHQFAEQSGTRSTIAFGYGDKADPAGFSMYSWLGTHLHSFLSRKLCMQGLCSPWQTARLVRYLMCEDPDVIHLHNIHGHYLNYPMLFRYLRKCGKPVVWTFHDCWPFTGKCAHYFSAGCEKWKTGCHDCPNLKTYPDSTYDGTVRNYRLKKKWFSGLEQLTVVSNSRWVQEQAAQSFLKEKPIITIYNGVDVQAFRPCGDRDQVRARYGIAPDKFMILGVSGVWKKEKGLDTFMELTGRLPEDCVLVMAGVSDADRRRLPPGIIGIPRLESVEALAELYSAADVLLNPSREETFGMVAAEAMACGTPVVVADTTACPELVKEHTGFCVDTRDLNAVCGALMQVKRLGKTAFSASCRQNILEHYTTESMCVQYWKLYQQLTEA